jgi:transposase
MANKLKVQEQEAIASLSCLGWGIRRIARELRLSRNTVRSYVRSLSPASEAELMAEEILKASALWPARPGKETDPLSTTGSAPDPNQLDPVSTAGNTGRKSLCADHAELILAKFEEGLTAQRIYQELREEISFAGSYQSVKRYVRGLRRTDPQVVQRIEVEPGEEVQVDFGTGPTLLQSDGKKRKTWIFRLVLSYSRKAYSQAVLRQDTETFLRCIEAAFREFGGSTLTINLDNLKAAVLKADWADPELNPKLMDFVRHYRTTIMPCLPGVPLASQSSTSRGP